MSLLRNGKRRVAEIERSLETMVAYTSTREAALRYLKRLGWVGGLGLGLLLVSLLVDLFVSVESFRSGHELSTESARLTRQLTGGAAPAAPRTATEAFYARFPAQVELPRVLAKLSEIASANTMNVVRADYRAAEQPGTPLLRMNLTLPVQGNYAALHAGLAEMLDAMPEVALEALALHRVDRMGDLVEGEARLVIFARRP